MHSAHNLLAHERGQIRQHRACELCVFARECDDRVAADDFKMLKTYLRYKYFFDAILDDDDVVGPSEVDDAAVEIAACQRPGRAVRIVDDE